MQTQISIEGTEANGRLTAASRAEGGEVAASVHGLSKSFHGTRVLHDINFDVAEGESLVLLGASGSGKTTILRIIAGLEAPDAGQVVLHGRDVTQLPARARHRCHLSVIRSVPPNDGRAEHQLRLGHSPSPATRDPGDG